MSCYLVLENHVTKWGSDREREFGMMMGLREAHLAGRGNAHAHRAARGSVAAWVGRDGHSYDILFL
jgi:hypothetical protein